MVWILLKAALAQKCDGSEQSSGEFPSPHRGHAMGAVSDGVWLKA